MAWVKCMVCGALQPEQRFRDHAAVKCTVCSHSVKSILMPALYKSAAPPPPLPVQAPAPGEAVCFYDSNRRATKSCSHCGVFISDTWAALWGTETVCLKCLGDLRKKGDDTRFQAKRTLWDNLTLGLSIGPHILALLLLLTAIGYPVSVVLVALTIITAPTAMFVGLRHWNSPRSLVPRSRSRLIWGILLAIIQVVGWIALIISIVYAIRNPEGF